MSNEKKLPEFELGDLSESERESLIEVLKEHVAGFERILAGDSDTIEIPPEKAEVIKNRVIESIHRGDLSAEIVRFGTQGFVEVILSFLNPGRNRPKQNRWGSPT